MSRARASILVSAALVACGAAGPSAREPAAPAGEREASATNGSSEDATVAAGDGAPSATPATPPLSSVPECDAYLRLYQRCEPTLRPSIAAGDRRDFVHEAAWLELLAGTPDVAGMPVACRDMMRELETVCP